MSEGEFITRASIWISILAYMLGCILFATGRSGSRVNRIVRYCFTIACLALVAHFVAAFHFYHHWSQASALAETTRQTNEVFGLNWGGGLAINYAVLLLWMIDVALWWMKGLDSYLRRPLTWLIGWNGFLIFIIFNATVVFKDGVQRWLGLLICLILCLAWYSIIKTKRPGPLSTE